MEKYKDVAQFCEDIGCQMLTSFEEFEEKRQKVLKQSHHYVRIDFIGVCGHASSAVVTNFIKRKTGMRCKDCVKRNTSHALKNKKIESSETETMGIQILEDYIKDDYEVIRTNEGCRADLAIRRKNGDSDLYMGVQIKTTMKKIHNMYSFRGIGKKYDNMIIICICISEKKLWLITYDKVNLIDTLNISSRSKYNKYLIENNELLTCHLDNYIDKYCVSDLKELLTPLSIYQKREQEYVQKREYYVDFLEYVRPNVQNTPTDFMVNDKKVQEKVCGYSMVKKKFCLIAHLCSNNGKENGKRTYCLGENDYYWFHSSIDDRFWIVPERVIYEKGLISDVNIIKGKKTIFLESKYFDPYKYDYTDYDKYKILELFT